MILNNRKSQKFRYLFAMAAATALRRGLEGFLHDAADGARTAAALRAAAQAAIDLTRGQRRIGSLERRPHVVVGDHVAGADDHVSPGASPGAVVMAARAERLSVIMTYPRKLSVATGFVLLNSSKMLESLAYFGWRRSRLQKSGGPNRPCCAAAMRHHRRNQAARPARLGCQPSCRPVRRRDARRVG